MRSRALARAGPIAGEDRAAQYAREQADDQRHECRKWPGPDLVKVTHGALPDSPPVDVGIWRLICACVAHQQFFPKSSLARFAQAACRAAQEGSALTSCGSAYCVL